MLGTALELASKILGLMGKGGPFIYVLLALSVLALTIIFAKLWQFRSRRVGRRRFAKAILQTWQDNDSATAIDQVAKERGPIAVVLRVAMQGRVRASMDTETIEVDVKRVARDELSALDTGLRGLELIALLAPLVGLLGTLFDLIGIGSSEVPLENALVTTIAGLGISIVAAIFYYVLDGRVERERRAIEAAVETVLTTGGADNYIDEKDGARFADSDTIEGRDSFEPQLS